MTKHVTSPEILLRAHKFAKTWAQYHCKPDDLRFHGNDLVVSASACYERNRIQGGTTAQRNQHLRDYLDSYRKRLEASEEESPNA